MSEHFSTFLPLVFEIVCTIGLIFLLPHFLKNRGIVPQNMTRVTSAAQGLPNFYIRVKIWKNIICAIWKIYFIGQILFRYTHFLCDLCKTTLTQIQGFYAKWLLYKDFLLIFPRGLGQMLFENKNDHNSRFIWENPPAKWLKAACSIITHCPFLSLFSL